MIPESPARSDWRDHLARAVVEQRHSRRRRRISRDHALQRLEWEFEELLLHDKRRITREHFMILATRFPIPMNDVIALWRAGTVVTRLLDKCFELLGEQWQHQRGSIGEEAS